jgi:hypothetical protein
MKKTTYFAAVLLLATFARESLADGIYNNAHDLMVEAIRTGSASGVMTGDIAKKFSEQFRSNGSRLVSAKVEKRYKQKGCARLSVNYTKKQVQSTHGMTDALLKTQINYCLDGRAPDSLEEAQ